MNSYGYKEPGVAPIEGGLLDRTVKYLEVKGWYFDTDHFREVYEEEPSQRDFREAHCWTVPQWGSYWSKGDTTSRRYECLKDALWSQILREQEPKQFAGFFEMEEA